MKIPSESERTTQHITKLISKVAMQAFITIVLGEKIPTITSEWKLAAVSNHNFALGCATLPAFGFNLVNHVHSRHHLAKHNMSAIQPVYKTKLSAWLLKFE